MGKPQETFNKKEKEKKRLKKRQEKQAKKEARQKNSEGGGLENMMAYVDEFGNIIDEAPDPDQKTVINAEDIEIGIPKKEEREEDALMKGKVEFFNETKGFGFIKELSTNKKFFVHVKGLIDDIKENNLVTFELEQGPKGMNAVRVRRV